eukprot:1869917-Rhodomonas_salina.1
MERRGEVESEVELLWRAPRVREHRLARARHALLIALAEHARCCHSLVRGPALLARGLAAREVSAKIRAEVRAEVRAGVTAEVSVEVEIWRWSTMGIGARGERLEGPERMCVCVCVSSLYF